ncbi:putative glycoside hydrolase [Nocardia sp. NBC_01009]|uniref:putative glycoside hydrolase n=1 Tax=Nocardia sp. NBC_01009 TaxID=2975996 RepID=UPI003863864D|nr:putative glycoside hydrolase [Nocardia sp. NBC_01009]
MNESWCALNKSVLPTGRRRLLAIAFIAVLSILVASVTIGAFRAEPEGLTMTGLPEGVVGASAMAALELRVDARGHDPNDMRLELDGEPVTGAVAGNAVSYRPGNLADGTHRFTAEIRSGGLLGFLKAGPGVTKIFTVDTEPPTVELSQPASVPSYRQSVVLRGKATGADHVSVGTQSVPTAADGSFEITVPRAPVDAEMIAVDAAGNTAAKAINAAVDLPRIKAVHVTAYAWMHEGLRAGVLDMAREGRINTVQLDIKDEDGIVGYDSQVPLARASGAAAGIYDARAALQQLHDMNLSVVGRIVAFRDPTMAEWAWREGHRDWVIQNPSGEPYSSHYGAIAFTNFADPEIRKYNIDLAVEAAELGFDGIMYDYVRRPDGSLSQMQFPGLTDTPSVSIAQFLRESRDPVRDKGAHLGAAVFGIASTRPDAIAQDIPMIAQYVDYVAPMLYPSHWNPGEYDVANPNSQPYDIVFRSLADFNILTAGTHADVIPWLQDFSLGVNYGDAEVRAQIDAAAAAGDTSFFLWNAATRYHSGALSPN